MKNIGILKVDIHGKFLKKNHYEISAAITVAVSLFITAIGLKKDENKDKKQN